MFFSKKKTTDVVPTVIDKKVDGIIRYAHNYGGYYYRVLAKQFDDFKKDTAEYSFAFMELYTVAALGVSLHSPTIGKTDNYNNVLGSMQKQLQIYFNGSHNDIPKILLEYINFEYKIGYELLKSGYNFSDIAAYWLLNNLTFYKGFENNYPLISTLGDELTNHFIFIFEDTWEHRTYDGSELLELMRD